MSVQNKVRAVLRPSDGMTVRELVEATGHARSAVHMALVAMPDSYIDRWVRAGNQDGPSHSAVWAVVVPPEDCPHPTKGRHEP
jgi:hypothetical protein